MQGAYTYLRLASFHNTVSQIPGLSHAFADLVSTSTFRAEHLLPSRYSDHPAPASFPLAAPMVLPHQTITPHAPHASPMHPSPNITPSTTPVLSNLSSAASAPAPQQEPRRKRDALSLREKARIIRILQETGQSRRALARDLQIPRATMHSIWKNKDHILAKSNTLPEQSLDSIKRCRPPQYPELEDRVYAFCLFVRSHRKQATKSLIIAKARRLASEMGITGFAASNGWYSKFLRRRGLPGQGGRARAPDSDESTFEQRLQLFRQSLTDVDVHNIYTVQESRFLYRCLPNRAFLSSAQGRSGATLDTNEPRITFNICANATGNHIIPLMFVGKERSPVSFDLADTNDAVTERYFAQANAWMDATLFEKWLRSWYDMVRTTSEPPWALVLNSDEANDRLPALPGVKYVSLPHGSPKTLQPMTHGVVVSVKMRARKHMLQAIVRALDTQDDFLSVANTLRPGAAGVVYGRKATILDAMRFLTAGLRDVHGDEIARCWLKAGILPSDHENVLTEIVNRAPRAESSERADVGALLTRVSIAIGEHNLRRDFERELGKFDGLPADAVDRWMGYLVSNEDEAQAVSGVIGDTQEEILAASEAAERATAASRAHTRDVDEENPAAPEQRTALQRLQAAHASAAAAAKIVQTALNEVSLHSTNHVVLGKLAEALRLATDDRNDKKSRLDMLDGSGRVSG